MQKVNRRVLVLEQHIAKCDERNSVNREQDLKLSASLNTVVIGLEAHLKREEIEMRKHTEVLEAISDKLMRIDTTLALQPERVQNSVREAKDQILSEIRDEFATREELNSDIDSVGLR